MKNKTFNIVLIVVGIAALVNLGVSYVTCATVVHIGPLQLTSDMIRALPLTPITGAILLVSGIVLANPPKA